jgi:lipopolysaccharide biosynthesis regulator YciM
MKSTEEKVVEKSPVPTETMDEMNTRISKYLKIVPSYGRCIYCGWQGEVEKPFCPQCKKGTLWRPNKKN